MPRLWQGFLLTPCGHPGSARVSISSPNPERSGIMYNLNVQNIHLRTAQ